jgi:hypothetical protein
MLTKHTSDVQQYDKFYVTAAGVISDQPQTVVRRASECVYAHVFSYRLTIQSASFKLMYNMQMHCFMYIIIIVFIPPPI